MKRRNGRGTRRRKSRQQSRRWEMQVSSSAFLKETLLEKKNNGDASPGLG